MEIIGSKAKAKELMKPVLEAYSTKTSSAFIELLHSSILKKKIRFPILEFIATELFNAIPSNEQTKISDKIMGLHEIGGNVLAGFMLQLRLEDHFKNSLVKAEEYIILGDQWYVCDIIGERVMGYALLTWPEKTIPVLKEFTKHPDKWIVRCVGVATHYAVKKGLKKPDSEQMFQLLLSCSGTTDFHTKKGIGWAAKTISKFHPDIIQNYKTRIENDGTIKQWFKTKIKIGLSRSFKYASRYPG